jgi:hypothetical protein
MTLNESVVGRQRPAPAPADEYTACEVRDGGRRITFEGLLLARVSSERPHAPRWTVMELYRQVRGMYVVHRIGESKVYHTSDCSFAQANKLHYGHELLDGPPTVERLGNLSSCSQCLPKPTDPPETLRFERQRHWSGVAKTSDAVVDMLHRTDNGGRQLPWIAANLLSEASIRDASLAQSYMTEKL